jgi:hypothetical protein
VTLAVAASFSCKRNPYDRGIRKVKQRKTLASHGAEPVGVSQRQLLPELSRNQWTKRHENSNTVREARIEESGATLQVRFNSLFVTLRHN